MQYIHNQYIHNQYIHNQYIHNQLSDCFKMWSSGKASEGTRSYHILKSSIDGANFDIPDDFIY